MLLHTIFNSFKLIFLLALNTAAADDDDAFSKNIFFFNYFFKNKSKFQDKSLLYINMMIMN
jgi:hypothetical protein